jgi:hypothetical protein
MKIDVKNKKLVSAEKDINHDLYDIIHVLLWFIQNDKTLDTLVIHLEDYDDRAR